MSSSKTSGKIGLIIVGSGSMGRVHASHWAKIDEVELRAVAGLDSESARNLPGAGSARQYSSLGEALVDTTVDFAIVDICTPTSTHKELAVAALAAKKHVMCEKPMGRTLADCDAIIEAAQGAATTVMVGHVVRWFPEFALAKRQVDAGAVGSPAAIRTSRMAAPPSGGWNNWFWNFEMSGGVVLDMIIHDFDWLLWTFGPIDRVFAKGLCANPEFAGKLDYALCTFHHTSGALSHVTGSWAEPSGFRTTFEICGDAGMLTHDSNLASPLSITLRETQPGKPGVIVPGNVVVPTSDPYYKELRHFTDCVLSGRPPDITLGDARTAVEIGVATLKSIHTGEPVTIG